MKEVKNLNDIRNAIDEIDTQIIDLLKERSLYIPFVKEIKKDLEAKIAFAREGQMGHSLMQRDFGNYNKLYMQRIWRELIMATLFIEGPFNIAMLKPKDTEKYIQIRETALAQFSFNTKITGFKNVQDTFESVLSNNSIVAIFAHEKEAEDKWWVVLKENTKFNNIKLSLALPFLPTTYNKDVSVTSFCCSKAKIEETGHDLSYFVADRDLLKDFKESFEIIDKYKDQVLITVDGFTKTKENFFFVGTSSLPVKENI